MKHAISEKRFEQLTDRLESGIRLASQEVSEGRALLVVRRSGVGVNAALRAAIERIDGRAPFTIEGWSDTFGALWHRRSAIELSQASTVLVDSVGVRVRAEPRTRAATTESAVSLIKDRSVEAIQKFMPGPERFTMGPDALIVFSEVEGLLPDAALLGRCVVLRATKI